MSYKLEKVEPEINLVLLFGLTKFFRQHSPAHHNSSSYTLYNFCLKVPQPLYSALFKYQTHADSWHDHNSRATRQTGLTWRYASIARKSITTSICLISALLTVRQDQQPACRC